MAIELPKDGTLITDGQGHKWALYRLGNSLMSFDLGDATAAQQYNLAGFAFESPSWVIDGVDYSTDPNVVKNGNIAVLTAAQNEHGSMGAFWNNALKIMANPDARNDAEIQKIIVTRLSRDMSDTEFRALLHDTKFYQSRTETQRQWNDMGEADQSNAIENAKSKLRESYLETYGNYPDDNAIGQWATDVASGNIGYGAVVDAMRRQAAGDPESPWSRTLRGEGENRRLRGQQITDITGTLRDTAERWGVRLTDGSLKEWSESIVTNNKSKVDFDELMKDQSMALYPNKPRELATVDYAQSWMSTYSRLLEKSDGTVFNPTIQSALQRGVNLADFETELRKKPEWMETKNASDQLTSSAARLGQQMGF